MRLIDKGIIDLDKIYAQKREEIQHADKEAQAELERRVREDREIQEAQIEKEERELSVEEKGAEE